MVFRRSGIALSLIGLIGLACQPAVEPVPEPVPVPEPQAAKPAIEWPLQVDGLTISKLESSPAFADASLTLASPAEGETLAAGSVAFDFEVTGFELGAQTENPGNSLANSSDGQHIHFILDNDPYSAHYEANFEKELEAGQHVLLAFLSRSWHESIKAPGASLVRVLTVGDAAGAEAFDTTAPHLFYSRPKGTYASSDSEVLMLDFYLLNVDLSTDGYKVEASINGTDMTLTEWVPYVIEGLPSGEVEISLTLVDAEGDVVPGPFNQVTRTVTLQPAPAKESAG